jgi:hypothetical protein
VLNCRTLPPESYFDWRSLYVHLLVRTALSPSVYVCVCVCGGGLFGLHINALWTGLYSIIAQ